MCNILTRLCECAWHAAREAAYLGRSQFLLDSAACGSARCADLVPLLARQGRRPGSGPSCAWPRCTPSSSARRRCRRTRLRSWTRACSWRSPAQPPLPTTTPTSPRCRAARQRGWKRACGRPAGGALPRPAGCRSAPQPRSPCRQQRPCALCCASGWSRRAAVCFLGCAPSACVPPEQVGGRVHVHFRVVWQVCHAAVSACLCIQAMQEAAPCRGPRVCRARCALNLVGPAAGSVWPPRCVPVSYHAGCAAADTRAWPCRAAEPAQSWPSTRTSRAARLAA
jgi:hypothetical protein